MAVDREMLIDKLTKRVNEDPRCIQCGTKTVANCIMFLRSCESPKVLVECEVEL